MELTTLNFGDIESIVETEESKALHEAMRALAEFVVDEDYEVVNHGPYAFGIKCKKELPVAVFPPYVMVRGYGDGHSEVKSKLVTVYNASLDCPVCFNKRDEFDPDSE